MRVGMLGTGDVGRALGTGFATLGHEVMMGSRSATNDKAMAWAEETGPAASVGTFGQAAGFGELVVLATLGVANDEVLRSAGAERFRDKVVIDATNPLDFSAGMPPTLAVAGSDSGGERVQALLPEARVVKAFNIVGHALMFRPQLPGGPPDMFIAGDDDDAKTAVRDLLKEFGWGGVHDLGGIEASRYLEPMCMVWVLSAMGDGTWNQAFKLLRG